MIEENLMSLSYDGFKTRLTTEVPHLEKMGSFLRLIILEDERKLICRRLTLIFKCLLEKEKNITIKAFANIYSSLLHQQNLKFDFVYNITYSVWRNRAFRFENNGLSCLYATFL